MSIKAKIQYYYDIASPFSYLGFEILQRYNKPNLWSHHIDIEYIPVLIGGIMKLSGNQPPPSNKLKANWLTRDLSFSSKMHSIPIKLYPSPGFPINSLKVMRLLTLLKKEPKDVYEKCIEKFFKAYWIEEQDITQEDVLKQILNSVSYDIDKAKETLFNETKQLVDGGAFGAPWIVVTKKNGQKESFFGSDRFETIVYYLDDANVKYYGPNPSLKASL